MGKLTFCIFLATILQKNLLFSQEKISKSEIQKISNILLSSLKDNSQNKIEKAQKLLDQYFFYGRKLITSKDCYFIQPEYLIEPPLLILSCGDKRIQYQFVVQNLVSENDKQVKKDISISDIPKHTPIYLEFLVSKSKFKKSPSYIKSPEYVSVDIEIIRLLPKDEEISQKEAKILTNNPEKLIEKLEKGEKVNKEEIIEVLKTYQKKEK